jgi:hypothetical protein
MFNKSVDNFFGEAKERLGEGYLAALERAGIPSDTSSFSKLPASQLNVLFNELFITFDAIASGNVDFASLEDHLSGGSKLPAKYLINVPYSSRFTSIYMLNYLRSILGAEAVTYMCQHFQLKEDQFTSISEKNNLLLPHDICSYVRTYFGEDVVRAMGESSFDLFKNSATARDLSSQKTIKEFFEKFIFEVMPVHVERNYIWNIDRTGPNFIQISGQPHGEVVTSLNFKHNGIEALESLREGFIRALPRLIGIQNAQVERIRSISGGDPFDTYLIHYGRQEEKIPAYH